jgi:hypothetical protein
MSRTLRALLLALALVAGLVPAGAQSADPEPAGAVSSDTMSFVKNLPYVEEETGRTVNGGTDIEFATLVVDDVEREYAFAGTLGWGMQIVDITDPDAAEIVAVYDCGISQGDVQVFTRDDEPGRTFVAYTMDTGYSAKRATACYEEALALGDWDGGNGVHGTFIVEVTDPTQPTTIAFIPLARGSHNQTVHPSGKFLYNSNSELIDNAANAGIEVIDLTVLDAPRLATTLPIIPLPGLGTDSHDITFNSAGTRAYSAALSHTLIIDTTDPLAPVTVSRIVDPMINVEHQANPITIDDPTLGKRDFLIIEDELAGAAGAEPACPSGGVHVYDITGDLEVTPVKVGYWNISELRPTTGVLDSCTAHVFQLHEEAALMTIAFYNGGIRVVDLSGLVGVALGETGVGGMREVGFWRVPNSNSWSAKTNDIGDGTDFHVYSNDIRRGLDIVRFQADGEGEGTGQDTWLSPKVLVQRAALAPRSLLGGQGQGRPICLLPRA